MNCLDSVRLANIILNTEYTALQLYWDCMLCSFKGDKFAMHNMHYINTHDRSYCIVLQQKILHYQYIVASLIHISMEMTNINI